MSQPKETVPKSYAQDETRDPFSEYPLKMASMFIAFLDHKLPPMEQIPLEATPDDLVAAARALIIADYQQLIASCERGIERGNTQITELRKKFESDLQALQAKQQKEKPKTPPDPKQQENQKPAELSKEERIHNHVEEYKDVTNRLGFQVQPPYPLKEEPPKNNPSAAQNHEESNPERQHMEAELKQNIKKIEEDNKQQSERIIELQKRIDPARTKRIGDIRNLRPNFETTNDTLREIAVLLLVQEALYRLTRQQKNALMIIMRWLHPYNDDRDINENIKNIIKKCQQNRQEIEESLQVYLSSAAPSVRALT